MKRLICAIAICVCLGVAVAAAKVPPWILFPFPLKDIGGESHNRITRDGDTRITRTGDTRTVR
jgi:hypothetical protein